MGKIYSVCNFKGGCGKTSTALNLGAALVKSGKSAILIDSDAQGNLTAALGCTPIEQPRKPPACGRSCPAPGDAALSV